MRKRAKARLRKNVVAENERLRSDLETTRTELQRIEDRLGTIEETGNNMIWSVPTLKEF